MLWHTALIIIIIIIIIIILSATHNNTNDLTKVLIFRITSLKKQPQLVQVLGGLGFRASGVWRFRGEGRKSMRA